MAFNKEFWGELSRRSAEKAAMSPENRKDLQARENFESSTKYILKDEREREAMSKETRVVQLAENVSSRFDMNEGQTSTLYLVPEGEKPDFDRGGNISRAIFKGSEAERLARQESSVATDIERMLGRLDRGSIVTLLGEDRPRKWKDGKGHWHNVVEFHAAKVVEGRLTHEEMLAYRRGDRAEAIADAAVAFDKADTPEAKEAIARAHLGQPEKDRPSTALPTSKGPDRDDDVEAFLADVAKDMRGKGR